MHGLPVLLPMCEFELWDLEKIWGVMMTNQPVTVPACHACTCTHSDQCFPTLWQRSVFQLHMSRASSHGFVVCMHLFLHHWHFFIIQDAWLFKFQALQVSFIFSFSCHISHSPVRQMFCLSGFKTHSIRAFQRCQCHLKASSGSRDIHNLASGWGFGLMGWYLVM